MLVGQVTKDHKRLYFKYFGKGDQVMADRGFDIEGDRGGSRNFCMSVKNDVTFL